MGEYTELHTAHDAQASALEAKIQEVVGRVKAHVSETSGGAAFEEPSIGLILGSGLGFIADHFEDATVIPYTELPHFPRSTIVGHEGSLVIGRFEGKLCVCMKGRVHYYEGYEMRTLAFPIYVMRALGIKTLLVTNAAGGVNPTFKVGDLMLIEDHLNFLGDNPLRGPNLDAFGPRFPDMTFAYADDIRAIWREVASAQGVSLREGVYAAMLGPSYETPAEIRMLHRLGADAVGMSTVPEVIVAAHSSIKVTALSVITNQAAGLSGQPLSHDEVKEASELARAKLVPLLKGVIKAL